MIFINQKNYTNFKLIVQMIDMYNYFINLDIIEIKCDQKLLEMK